MNALLLLVGALGASLARPAPVLEPDSLSRAGLERALAAFSAAFVRADAEALDTFLVSGYLHINGASGAVLDKGRWLGYVRGRREELASGRLRVNRYQSSEVTLRWHGETAVVSSRVDSEGSRDGVPFASRLRVTQVWVRVTGQWRRAAFHDSPAPDLPNLDSGH